MKEPKDPKKQKLEKNKKLAKIYYHEKIHAENRKKMHVADGGHTDDISMDNELETLQKSWSDRTGDMRDRLRKKKARAKAMWKGR